MVEGDSAFAGDDWNCTNHICGDRRTAIIGSAGASAGAGGHYGAKADRADAVKLWKRQPAGI